MTSTPSTSILILEVGREVTPHRNEVVAEEKSKRSEGAEVEEEEGEEEDAASEGNVLGPVSSMSSMLKSKRILCQVRVDLLSGCIGIMLTQ